MTSLHSLNVQMNDDRRAGQTRGECGRHSSRHFHKDHVSGVLHERRKRALRSFSSSRRFALNCRGNGELLPAIPGNLFFNLSDARNRLRWQALTDLARVRCHLKSLSSVLVQWMKIYLQVRTKNWESPPKFRRAI